MKFVGIVPARYGSTRLEGKPLVDINGKSMIQRVYEQASQALADVYIATDDERIEAEVKSFGGKVVLTSKLHTTGTNRCLEAIEKINATVDQPFDAVINVQGDEPMLVPDQLNQLLSCFEDSSTELATLIAKVQRLDDLFNESEVFVVSDKNDFALYFSRSVIPHIRDTHKSKWLEKNTFYKHVGLYAYTYNALKQFASMDQTTLELTESLEQNRWLENGGKIKVAVTEYDSIPVDTIDDLEKVRSIIKEKEGNK